MLRHLGRLLLLVAFALNLGEPHAHAANIGPPLELLLTQVQKALVKVREGTEADSLPPLSKVTLVLKTTLQQQADGSFHFWVVEVGADISSEAIQEMTLELAPPRPGDKSPVANELDPMADAIIAAAQSLKRASSAEPPLRLTKLTTSIQFTIQKDAAASAGFELLPITAKVGTKISDSTIQQAIIEFAEATN